LPARTADDILDDFIQAIGGRQPYEGRAVYTRSRLIDGWQHLVRPSTYGVLETWGMGASRRYMVTSPSQKSEGACDERSCWSTNRRHAARLWEGIAAEMTRIAQHPLPAFRLKEHFPGRRIVQPPPHAPTEAPLECVALSRPGLPSRVDCFDAGTHLRVYEEGTDSDGAPYRERYSDHRWVAGMRLCFRRERFEGEGLTVSRRTTELQEVKVDLVLAPDLFRAPAFAVRK
jgi:hypothetical protein